MDTNRIILSHLSPHQIKDPEMVEILKKHTLMLYNLPEDMNYFPGQLPCSLMRKDLQLLEDLDYYVAEKSDGVRCLLLIFSDGQNYYCLLIDRGFRFYRTNLSFDASLFKDFGTLFDGEIVQEPNGFKMYIHDVICLSGKTAVSKLPYHERIKLVRETLTFYSFPSAPKEDGEPSDIIQLLPKRVYPFSELNRLWLHEIPNLTHKNDGLVLTPDALPHCGRKCKELFKWKKPHEHTIDFQLGEMLEPSNQSASTVFDPRRDNEKLWVQTDDNYGRNWPSFVLYTWDTKEMLFFCTTAMSPEMWKRADIPDPRSEKGLIVECAYHSDKRMFIPIVARRDKLVPNDNYTVRRTITTIMEHLTIDELINKSRHHKEQKEKKRKRLE